MPDELPSKFDHLVASYARRGAAAGMQVQAGADVRQLRASDDPWGVDERRTVLQKEEGTGARQMTST